VVKESVTLAAVGDLHVTRQSQGTLQPMFAQLAGRADVLVMCGDLTDWGLPEEARVLARELGNTVTIPKLAVLGNHDYESGREQEVRQILCDAGVQILDGDAVEIDGIGFVGVKGFIGGFDRRMLEPWGEALLKNIVNEAVAESLKLESALAKLRTPKKVVLLHYAPIAGTVAGEPAEILPFLGCSRLEEPINRYGVDVVFHGHAHRGALEGRTREGVPVYNVAAPLLRRTHPGEPPFKFWTVRPGDVNAAAAE
jgi:Icc-related predicted phosphoesterase